MSGQNEIELQVRIRELKLTLDEVKYERKYLDRKKHQLQSEIISLREKLQQLKKN